MSLDLWVLKKDKISKELMISIREFLAENDFIEDEYSYCSANEDICVDIYIDQSSENDEWWDDMEELIDTVFYQRRPSLVIQDIQKNRTLQITL